MFQKKDAKWAAKAREVDGNVWVVALGMTMGMGTTGSMDDWSAIINGIESAGWRLQQIEAMPASKDFMGTTNSNMFAVFRRT